MEIKCQVIIRGGEDWKNGWTEAGALESCEVGVGEGQGRTSSFLFSDQVLLSGFIRLILISPEDSAWNLGL